MTSIPTLKIQHDVGLMLHSASEMFDAEGFTYEYEGGVITATEYDDKGEVVAKYKLAIDIEVVA